MASESAERKTPLHDAHVAAGARMVPFAGWSMPVNYGSLMDEHRAVREAAGMFDVSHMTVVDIAGREAQAYLRRLLANDVARLDAPGRALYGCMLDERGGVIDDLITYYREPGRYRTVVNAATRATDLDWMQRQAGDFDVDITEREDLAMIAIQGPDARGIVDGLVDTEGLMDIRPFAVREHGEWFIARTGYTGEDGFEIILPGNESVVFWNRLLEAGVTPCGLGARDSLRLEAGLNLYGQDMDTTTTPLESNLGWTVAFEPADRDFIGRAALEEQKASGVERELVGLVPEGRAIPRHGCRIVTPAGDGEVTSGTHGPTVGGPVALGRVPAGVSEDIAIEIRGRSHPARRVTPPFVRHGKVRI